MRKNFILLNDFQKQDIREQVTQEHVYQLLEEWGGEPEYITSGLLASTICHNKPGEGSRKLYWYSDSKLFRCFTGGCSERSFDIFELTIKVFKIQQFTTIDLNTAIHYVAQKCQINGINNDDLSNVFHIMPDEQYLNSHLDVGGETSSHNFTLAPLKIYDDNILNNLNYSIKLTPWLNEHISQEAIEQARIGYYLGQDQITIPHYDINGNFIGLRGRFMSKEDCALYGKYRPVTINNIMYTHPLGLNLYNLNFSKENIQSAKLAIVFESEKSCLQYKSYFGIDNDISVACCGSQLSAYHFNLLQSLNVREIVIAFDRQFQNVGDNEFKHLIESFKKINQRYGLFVTFSFIIDTNMITGYKASPTDEGKDKFLQLFKERTYV